ncbi:hypothetical protein F5883DRAFT_637902 [Diaporthe sp. PMI_573]|nr:hypothetical protein F5883DRAFT_637902 [Diaporthaceae sp. PMI_573]
MAQICCCNTGPPTIDNVLRSLDRLDNSINSPGTGSPSQEQDPSCECDPCTCPSDTVPCNADVLGKDFSNKGLLKKLSGLVRKARQVQAAQDDCVCADRPLYVERIPAPTPQPPSPGQPPTGQPPTGQPPTEQPPTEQPPTEQPPREQPRPSSPRPFVPRGLGFFNFPPEVRNMVYGYYFEGLDPIRTIAAARYRQGEQEVETRLWRNYQPRRRPRRRRLDPARLTEAEGRPLRAEGGPFTVEDVPIWLRDTATITYEPEATDEELQQLEDNRLGLLNTYNRQIWEEASAVFYGQNFHFTLPRPVNIIAADQGTFHSILAAEAFLRHRRLSRNHIRELEFDLWQQTGDPGQDADTYVQGEDPTDSEQAYDYSDWATDLFSIGRRDRFSIHMEFHYTVQGVDDARQRINDALYFIRILRNRLLTNAQVLGLLYQNIRVRGWNLSDGLPQNRFAIIESDDEWRRGRFQRHESHLLPPWELSDAELQAQGRPPNWAFMAQERSPAELPIPPPPPQPTPIQGRQYAPRPKSALDDSDEENA